MICFCNVVGLCRGAGLLAALVGMRGAHDGTESDAQTFGDLSPSQALASFPQYATHRCCKLRGRGIGNVLLGKAGFGKRERYVDFAITQLASSRRKARCRCVCVGAGHTGSQRDSGTRAKAADQRICIDLRTCKATVARRQSCTLLVGAGCCRGTARGSLRRDEPATE